MGEDRTDVAPLEAYLDEVTPRPRPTGRTSAPLGVAEGEPRLSGPTAVMTEEALAALEEPSTRGERAAVAAALDDVTPFPTASTRATAPVAVIDLRRAPAATAAPAGPVRRGTEPYAAALRPAYDLTPGTQLGEYRVKHLIGAGAMGDVYAAIHPLIGKVAAIKVLKHELCADRTMVERFVDEARVVNQIGHPNIVDIFAFGEMPDGRSFFVMEWLQGETLREKLARGPLPLGEIAAIVRPLCKALQAAHDHGVVHRDLKPDNIFLVAPEEADDLPAVKLLDFGIAKLGRTTERAIDRTATGAIVGTPRYIAPEQAKGHAVTAAADVYALGSIVFEMLTGRSVFEADNAMEMVAKHLMEPPPAPRSLAPGVPPTIDDLVLAMLAKVPDARPPLARVRGTFAQLFGQFNTVSVVLTPGELERSAWDARPLTASHGDGRALTAGPELTPLPTSRDAGPRPAPAAEVAPAPVLPGPAAPAAAPRRAPALVIALLVLGALLAVAVALLVLR